MNQVLEWVKANVFIVVFGLLMLAAVVGLPIFSGKMNEGVRTEVASRASNLSKLSQLEKYEILPGMIDVINEQMLLRYGEVAKDVSQDAESVQKAAIEHNRKGRGVLLAELFPEPPQNLVDVLPLRFHESLANAYATLLSEVKAGAPPDPATVRTELELVKKQFVNQDLKKDLSETLLPEEEAQLAQKLTNARMSLYAAAAQHVGLYLSAAQLGVPAWNQASPPSVGELFNWQWQYWIVEDVLRALHRANEADGSVLQAPVKQVISLTVMGLPMPASASQNPGGTPGRGGGGGFGGSAGPSVRGAPGGAGNPAASAGVEINPKNPVPRDYRVSITGRASNPLYDVINVEVALIVETARLPQA